MTKSKGTDKINIGIVGCGGRGLGQLAVLAGSPELNVAAVCDEYTDRMDSAAEIVKSAHGREPLKYKNYMDLIADNGVDAVFIYTSWESHIEIAVKSMEAGKATAMEVGGAYSIEDCWRLVNTYEKTKSPFMMLENCCFDIDELTVTNMVRKGLFGTVVHCSGAYGHDLRAQVAEGKRNRHYRLNNYLNHNCDNYPTHEVGPIAKILNINRGNRMISLVSMASKAMGMREYINARPQSEEYYLKDADFKQGDIVTTIIKCSNGETILLKLDTTLPRRYDREFCVCGTKGRFFQPLKEVFLDGEPEYAAPAQVCGNMAKHSGYIPSVWKNITEEERCSGHGGMDGLMIKAFIKAYKSGAAMPIDVYDAAVWMSISALSGQSIACGGAPVYMPDFTCGRWTLRAPEDVVSLD